MALEHDFWTADIAVTSRRIASGELSPVELTRAMLERIDKIDRNVQAYVTIIAEAAIAAAHSAEREIRAGKYRGPLHGVPIAIKDIYDTEGLVTTSCSRVRQDYVPTHDATVVRKLKEAGAIVLGKVSTHEFAFGFDSIPTRNPWNLDHIPSGSSGGSGAAIAAGLCFAATGSDTGGSIRAPAAANGIAGIKPSYGRVSKYGVTVLSWSLDHTGPMARTVRDLAILLGIISGRDALDPHTKDVAVVDYVGALTGEISGTRLGIPENYFFEDITTAVGDAMQEALRTLTSLGAHLVPVKIDHIEGALDCMLAIAIAEASVYHQADLHRTPEFYTEETRLLLQAGALTSASTFINAQRARETIKCAFREAFQGIDALITPTMPTTALKVGQKVSRIGSREETVFGVSARFCAPFNLAGLPAASVPCGFSPDGLPIGLQIIGKPFDEATVLKIADAYERATEWHKTHPEIATST